MSTIVEDQVASLVHKFWELEEIQNKSLLPTEEKWCEDFINTFVKVENRYEVTIPLLFNTN